MTRGERFRLIGVAVAIVFLGGLALTLFTGAQGAGLLIMLLALLAFVRTVPYASED